MKKKQTKTGPKSVTGFSILKIYLQESEPNQLFATAACLMDGDTGRVLF